MTVEEEEAFEREHGVAVNAGGSVVVATWGMGLGILFVGIAFSSLLLAYFYLRLENPLWPPPGISEPGLTRAIIWAALLVVSGRAVYAALRRVRACDQPGFIAALVATLLLALAGFFIQFGELTNMDFGATTHAYGSIFHTLGGFLGVMALGGIIMLAVALYWAVRGQYTSRRHATVANIARFWTAAVVFWVAGFATLYLGPYLT
jgi:cytochrome c oxidase subunit I+III